MSRLRVALAQINPVVGDLAGNIDRITATISSAAEAGADVVVLPELAVTGYPPEDLLLKPGFVQDNLDAIAAVAAATTEDCAAVVGFVEEDLDLYNSAAVCAGGRVRGVYRKQLLPNYGVFDEARYFSAGAGATQLFGIGGVRVGISICEDAWSPSGPIAEQAAAGAELIINLNASPFYAGRVLERERMLATRAADASCGLVYVNCVGGQDELVFDGASMVFDENGAMVASLPQFSEELAVVDVEVRPVYRKRLLDPRGHHSARPLPVEHVTGARVAEVPPAPQPPRAARCSVEEEIYRALVTGTRDYVRKNGFTDVVIGLSGGVDSSLVAAIAADALGPGHVHGVAMPSRYSSEGSRTDAEKLAANLGIDIVTVPIEPAHAAFMDMLHPLLGGEPAGLTEENLQSRIRGVLLMALSNRRGWLVLTTGNKSEAAVGYSTLYGDTAGGFAVIKDVAKTMVYRLCRWRESSGGQPVFPPDVLSKPPSAELRPDQRDDQSLPPYEVLDPVLMAYVEGDQTAGELVEAGHPADLVANVVRLVDLAEYKRRQTPPGVRVTAKAFGRDRRVPITNGYRYRPPE